MRRGCRVRLDCAHLQQFVPNIEHERWTGNELTIFVLLFGDDQRVGSTESVSLPVLLPFASAKLRQYNQAGPDLSFEPPLNVGGLVPYRIRDLLMALACVMIA